MPDPRDILPPLDLAAWLRDRDAFVRRLILTLALGPPRLARYRPLPPVAPGGAAVTTSSPPRAGGGR